MRISIPQLHKLRQEGEKITMLSCYDASFAGLCDAAGVEMFLVGDSLGMVVQGHDSTLPVTIDDMVYHTRCVVRGSQRALVVGDLSFGSYQQSPQQAFESAARLMAAGAGMVKLEGGLVMAETVNFLVQRGIPVMGHLGLTPQSVHTLGGYRVQGKTDEAAQRLRNEAKALQDAGAAALVLECVPSPLGKAVTEELSIPTIGIGGGPDCSGQILILHDMLDIYPGKKAKFVKNFMKGAGSVQEAVQNFVKEVKSGAFPTPEYCFA
ncbi:MAG: 3-methyl-2-oxobutanoate hydroxymethyltransferase [Betaproteobacteria bacterium]|nr:3-methyl-2-oxobutanoate hydroxymethyltransferase [Betaproteobacteria bacterium]MBL8533665.1 3-methyl-2-oxobutanoate hydroxymethyltransferase [Betaproteobacteria bacterium]